MSKIRGRSRTIICGFLVAGVWSAFVFAGSEQASIPSVIHTGPEHGSQPVWVSAPAAAADGRLREDLFAGGAQRNLKEQVARVQAARRDQARHPVSRDQLQPVLEGAPYLDEDLCQTSSVVFSPSEVPRDSFESLVGGAHAIVTGHVVAIEQGFVNGRPSSLLAVRVGEILRSSRELSASSSLFVVYPYAVFRIGEDTFCRDEPDFTYRPQIGDRLVLLPASEPIDAHDLMIWPEAEELIAEKPNGELSIAPSLQEQAPFVGAQSLHELVQEIRRSLVADDVSGEGS